MKSNAKRKAKLLAARETARGLDAREDARVDALVRLGKGAHAYSGRTPHAIDGRATFAPRVMQTVTRALDGRTYRAGKKCSLKFQPRRYDADAPQGGGARMPPGEHLTTDADGQVGSRVARTATGNMRYRPTHGGLAGEILTYAAPPINYTAGDDDAPIPDDSDPGDDDRTVAERAYWAQPVGPKRAPAPTPTSATES